MWIIALLLVGVFALSVWGAWGMCSDGAFSLAQEDSEVVLNYCYQGKWIEDSRHNTEDEARAQIRHYTLARVNRPFIRPE